MLAGMRGIGATVVQRRVLSAVLVLLTAVLALVAAPPGALALPQRWRVVDLGRSRSLLRH